MDISPDNVLLDREFVSQEEVSGLVLPRSRRSVCCSRLQLLLAAALPVQHVEHTDTGRAGFLAEQASTTYGS